MPTCTVVGLRLDYGEGTGQGANKQASSTMREWKEGYAPSLETLLV
ncbi:MAG: hypothetical protein OXI63_24360 [Candidatus Poribacteria bacterium]|nr:hypothetical protein [Candidatus Poribacteria bacterium]